MNWFGESWGAPCCDEDQHTETPAGEFCVECDQPIQGDDDGFVSALGGLVIAYHRRCFLRTVIPCEMWDDDLLTDMPDRWVDHRKERHGL